MGKNLAQAPLTAIIFAAIWCFSAPFFSISESYGAVLAEFDMPVSGYAFMIAYGLWVSVTLAVIFSNARGRGIALAVLTSIPVLFTQWVSPMARQLAFGETTGAMTQADSVFFLAKGVIATIFLILLALLLFKTPHAAEPPRPAGAPPKKPDKFRFRKRNFAVTLIVLPVIYMVAFFLTWYFVLLNNEPAWTYYMGDLEKQTFSQYLVGMLLNDNRQIPMSLITGLLYSLPLIPLLLQLAHKRAVFIITAVMLLLGPGLRMLVPSAVMPSDVRTAHLTEMSVAAVVFGALAAFMMHVCVFKEPSKDPVAAAKRKAAAPAAAPAAPPAAKS